MPSVSQAVDVLLGNSDIYRLRENISAITSPPRIFERSELVQRDCNEITEVNLFIDYAKISVQSGKGGAGSVSFHRAKFVPKGGPDGGDGGRGGDMVFMADPSLATLQDFKYKRKYVAKDGNPGSGNLCSGRSGKNIVVRVPLGTVVKDLETGTVLLDLVAPGVPTVLLPGGIGGKGNACFATSTNRAPRYAQPGIAGKTLMVILELKSMADVGLVGLPNAGKSTLLSSVSAARPKVADYPFTTLQPQLGIVTYAPYKNFVMADIPGLIKDSHTGRGLGHYFLRHIERTSVLLYIIDISDDDPAATLKMLRQELVAHDPELLKKPSLVVLNKSDLITPAAIPVNKTPQPDPADGESFDENTDSSALPVVRMPEMQHDFLISAATQMGLRALIQRTGNLVEKERAGITFDYNRDNYVNREFLDHLFRSI